MEGVCPLCEEAPAAGREPLCIACRVEQRRRMLVEAAGGGAFFVSLAVLLYLLGRWYAG